MPVTIPDFWRRLVESQLVSPSKCQKLRDEFQTVKGAAQQANARTLCEWLIAKQIISRYQSTILLAGRAGPFFYGDYRVFDRIKKGRLSGMFCAIHVPTQQSVLLRFLVGQATQDFQASNQLAQRVKLLFTEASPHVLRCYDMVDLEQFQFLVLELPRGVFLNEYLVRLGPIHPPVACQVARNLALGVAGLHKNQCIVGDLRPASVWLASRKITWAKLFFDPANKPIPINAARADLHSTPVDLADYVAPELGESGRMPDRLSDIYALGCTLYHMLSGRVPYPGGDVRNKLHRHATETIQPLRKLGKHSSLDKVVTSMMAKNPSARYQFAEDVVDALTPLVDSCSFNMPALHTEEALVEHIQARQHQANSLPTDSTSESIMPSFDPSEYDAPQCASVQSVGANKSIHVGDQSELNISSVVAEALAGEEWTRVVARRQRRHRVPRHWLIVGGAIAGLVMVGIMLGAFSRGGGDGRNGEATLINNALNQNTIASVNTDDLYDDNSTSPIQPVELVDVPSYEVVPDDGSLLWSPSTSGAPVDFHHVPADAQLVLFFQSAAFLSSDEGHRVLDALGPDFRLARKKWETMTGLRLEEIESMLLTFHPTGGDWPRTSIVVRLQETLSETAVKRWGTPQTADNQYGKIFHVDDWSLLVPDEKPQRIFLMGSDADVQDVVQREGAPPVLRRELEQLRLSTDIDRHLTIIAAPNFFFSDGRSLFSDGREPLLNGLSWFLGDGLQGAIASLHITNSLFWELRFIGQLDRPPQNLQDKFRQRLDDLPSRIADYFVALNPPAYWRELALRFPFMINEMRCHARVGFEGQHVVVNGYLQPYAAHNLMLGAELASASTPVAYTSLATGKSGDEFTTLPDLLKGKRIDFEVLQQSLEITLRDLSNEVNEIHPKLTFNFRIRILGADLHAAGITRNQQIRNFRAAHKTVGDVLTELLVSANPGSEMVDPTEESQQLVWVLAPDPDKKGGPKIILVTTRKAAQQKGYELPEHFREKKT